MLITTTNTRSLVEDILPIIRKIGFSRSETHGTAYKVVQEVYKAVRLFPQSHQSTLNADYS